MRGRERCHAGQPIAQEGAAAHTSRSISVKSFPPSCSAVTTTVAPRSPCSPLHAHPSTLSHLQPPPLPFARRLLPRDAAHLPGLTSGGSTGAAITALLAATLAAALDATSATSAAFLRATRPPKENFFLGTSAPRAASSCMGHMRVTQAWPTELKLLPPWALRAALAHRRTSACISLYVHLVER